MSAVVERWKTNGMECTSPPQPLTSAAPTMLSTGQSPPLTSTSGRRARMSLNGVSSSKGTTKDTDSSAASTAMRSASGLTGRSGALFWRRTESSEFTPTTSAAPSARACAR